MKRTQIPTFYVITRHKPNDGEIETLARHLNVEAVRMEAVSLHLPEREEELAEVVEPYLWHGTPGARPLLVGTFPTRHVLALLNLGIAVGWFEADPKERRAGVYRCTGLRVCRLGPGGRILTRRTPCPVAVEVQKGGAR